MSLSNKSIETESDGSRSEIAAEVNTRGNTSKNVNVLDRYIPQHTSQKAYKAVSFLKHFSSDEFEILEDSSTTPQRLSSPEFFTDLESTSYYSALSQDASGDIPTQSVSSSSQLTNRRRNIPQWKRTKEYKNHRKYIAKSLDLYSTSKVFQYRTPNIEVPRNIRKELPNLQIALDTDTKNIESKPVALERDLKRAKSHIPYRILDAPSLRNDFYSNLVSWSKRTSNILVGLGCSVYMWSETSGAIPILNQGFLRQRNDLVTCVSFSPFNTKLLIGTKRGTLLLYDQDTCVKHFRKFSGSISMKPLYEYSTQSCKGITCVEWFNNNDLTFIFGGESGDVSLMRIIEDFNKSIQLCIAGKFQAQSQQVCGMHMKQTTTLLLIEYI